MQILVDVHRYTACMAGMLSLTSSLEPRQTIERVAVDSILWSSMDPFPSWDEPPAACEKQEQRKPGKTCRLKVQEKPGRDMNQVQTSGLSPSETFSATNA